MAKINFKLSEVQSTISGLSEIETNLNDKIKELNDKKALLSNFWSSTEAANFSVQLQTVQNNLSNFMKKYDGYLSFLNSVVTAYGQDEASFAATINSIAANQGSESQ